MNDLHAPASGRTPTGRWKALLTGLAVLCLVGCTAEEEEEDFANYTAAQKDAIAAASRAVRQYEDWAEKAEYKIKKHSDGWQITAWRVEHSEAKGNARYLPWGYRVITVDRRGKVSEYKNSR